MNSVDPFGLPITTSSKSAAIAYSDAMERFINMQSGALEAATESLRHDPQFALARCLRGLIERTRGDMAAAAADVRGAVESVASTRPSEREQSHVRLFETLTNGDTSRFEAGLLAHLALWPRDATAALFIHFFYNIMSAAADRDLRMVEVSERIAPAYGGDWFGTSLLAFACEEGRQFTRSGELAETALAARPQNGRAAHTLAHVRLETGQSAVGGPWITAWTQGWAEPGPFICHLHWHKSLFQLALGDTNAAIESLDEVMAWTGRSLSVQSDGPALAWRLHLDGHRSAHWPTLAAFPCPPGPAFMNAHRALALAGAGDVDGLEGTARAHDELASPAVTATIISALCRALASFVDEDYSGAAQGFDELRPVVRSLGGSHAQTEVFHDTHIAALERSDQRSRAALLQRDRLAARASVRDERWLERVR